MKKFLTILVMCGAIGLAGCQNGKSIFGMQNPINNNELASLISAYGIADSAVIGYAGLPRCTTSRNLSPTFVCHKRSVLIAAQAFDAQANAAINRAVAFQRNNPTLDASSYVQAAQAAFEIFKGFVTANGVM